MISKIHDVFVPLEEYHKDIPDRLGTQASKKFLKNGNIIKMIEATEDKDELVVWYHKGKYYGTWKTFYIDKFIGTPEVPWEGCIKSLVKYLKNYDLECIEELGEDGWWNYFKKTKEADQISMQILYKVSKDYKRNKVQSLVI